MRKNLISIVAIVFAICLSAFQKRTFTVYMIYEGSGPQNWISSYTQDWWDPGWYTGTAVLAWFSFPDDNGVVTTAEFQTAFEALDVYADSWNSLDDDFETLGGDYELEKKDREF